jgi:hypothetical protein
LSEEFLPTDGEVIARNRLVLPKAKQLAGLLDRQAIPFARLIECRRADAVEIVVLDVDVELGQTQVHPIRSVERIAVRFDTQDRAMPEVHALRASFPRVPHLLLGAAALPRSLCLFDQAYRDLKARWTAPLLVERIRDWLRLTARGELHDEDQPLEPVLLGGVGAIVVPHDLFSQGKAAVTITRLPDHIGRGVLVARSGTSNANFPRTHVGLIWACAPRVHGVIERAPVDLAGLHELVAGAGDDLAKMLRQNLREWMEIPGALDVPLILIIGFPKLRTAGPTVEATDIWAFLTGRTVREVGEAVGLWASQGGTVGLLIPADRTRRGEGIVIDVLNVVPTMSRVSAARLNGRSVGKAPRITAVGVGALGSQVLMNAVRAGYGQWTTIDRDLFWPHNGARHALDGTSTGRAKAEAVARTAATVTDGVAPVMPIVADVLDPGDAAAAVNDAFRTADVIVDMSASVSVARHLSEGVDAGARRISAFLNPTGTDLVLLAEDVGRGIHLNQLELQYYRAVYAQPQLVGHLRAVEGRVRYGRSCRDVSATIPQDAVALHAAIATRAIRQTVDEPSAAIRVWRTAGDSFNVEALRFEAYEIHAERCGGWTIYFDSFVREKLAKLRAARLPNETGGVLIGAVDLEQKTIGIVDTIPSPSDSEEWPTGYIRGCEGLVAPVRAIWEATAEQLHYVGEWHSHPDGFSCSPSNDDVKVLQWLTERMSAEGLPGLIVIVGEQEVRPYVGDCLEG